MDDISVGRVLGFVKILESSSSSILDNNFFTLVIKSTRLESNTHLESCTRFNYLRL